MLRIEHRKSEKKGTKRITCHSQLKYHAFQIKSLPSPLLLLLFLPPSKFLGVFRAVVCSLFFPLSPARHEFWKVVAGGSGEVLWGGEEFLLSWRGV